VIYTTDKHIKEVDASGYSAASMAIRYLEISHYYKNADGLLRAKYAFPNVNFRNIIHPSSSLPNNIWTLNYN